VIASEFRGHSRGLLVAGACRRTVSRNPEERQCRPTPPPTTHHPQTDTLSIVALITTLLVTNLWFFTQALSYA
jgi:hypothetical protein